MKMGNQTTKLLGKITNNIYKIKNIKSSTNWEKEYFQVRIYNKGNNIQKLFETLEEAITYRDAVLSKKDNSTNNSSFGEYPANLIDELLPVYFEDYKDVYDNFDTRLDYVLEHFVLTDKEKKALLLNYRENKNLDAVGKELGITRERVRQIVAKAIRKLRNPRIRDYFLYGQEVMELQEAHKNLQQELEIKINKLSKLINELDDIDNKKIDLSDELKEAINDFSQNEMSILKSGIETLDFTVRTYKCLQRHGITDIGGLINCPLKELMGIRNLGRKSVKEVIQKVYEIDGLEFNDPQYSQYYPRENYARKE